MAELKLDDKRVWFRAGSDERDPERPTVVFVHGAGASSLTWIYQLRALRRGANCIAVDLPGHGKSDDDTDCDTIEGCAAWLARVLDGLGVVRCVLVGHSMGGAIALETAATYPDRVVGVAVIGVGAVIPVSPLIAEALRGREEVWTKLMDDLLFSPTTPRRFVDKTSASGLQASRNVVIRDFQACERWSRLGRLAEVVAPCLLIVGHDDALTPVPLVEAVEHELPGARIEIIDDAGHMAMVEQHKRVNELIDAFVGKVVGIAPVD